MIADMHTHSFFSHDSRCSIEDMCRAQIEKGTRIFAVPDHCDLFLSDRGDIFTPVKSACEEVELINEKFGDRCLVLAGIEICESIHCPRNDEIAHGLYPFDVIIGSVHSIVQNGEFLVYSQTDFSKLSKSEIYNFLETYFNDMALMVKTADIDIAAHLTCPIRYIKGRFGIDIDISRFDEIITEILQTVIDRKIALEINTSSYPMYGDFLPSVDIIKQYHDMGGQLITLASDAHTSENASFAFPEAIKALREIGFGSAYYFVKRKPFEIKL